MEYNNKLCVEVGWLCEEVITKATCDNMKRRGQLRVVRRGGNGRAALVEYDSIPARVKSVIIEKLGSDPAKVTPATVFAEYIVPDAAARSYFSEYLLEDGRNLPSEVQLEYCCNAEILNGIGTSLLSQKIRQRALGGCKNVWPTIADIVSSLNRIVYPHSLPANQRRLYDKYSLYRKESYPSLIHRGFCRRNAKKVTERLERLILSIYCMENKPYSAWVHEYYLRFVSGGLEIVDIETGEMFERSDFIDPKTSFPVMISESTCWNYINKPVNRAIVGSVRMSYHKFNGRRPFVHRHEPNFSLSKVSLDDRDLPRKTPNGKRVKAYYAVDVKSGAVIGAAYSMDKNKDLFIGCVRDMFRFIEVRGWGVPMEVEVEHHLVESFRDGLMQAGLIFPFVRWCAPTNSQEKYAETVNRLKKYGTEKKEHSGIGRWYASLESNQTEGERVYDDASASYIFKEKTYEWSQLVADDKEDIIRYNSSKPKGKERTRLQILVDNLNPGLPKMNRSLLARYIGDKSTTSIQRNHFCSVQGCDYGLPSPELLGRLSPNNYSVDAYYIPEENGEINEVYLYQNDVFVGECKKIVEFNRAKSEWTDFDETAMVDQMKYIKKFDILTKEGRGNLAKVVTMENSESFDVSPVEVPVVELVVESEYEYSAEFVKMSALEDL